MNFLIDAQLPPTLCRWLATRGHAAVHVVDIGLGSASDAVIASRVETEGERLVEAR